MANPESNETTDFLYLLDNCKYLHLKSGTDGYTYSVYDAQTKLKELTGIYPHPAEHFQTACMEICEFLHLGKHSVVSPHMDELSVLQALNDYNEERPYRYFITAEALKIGNYPFPEYAEIHETITSQQYENGTVTAFGFIDLPFKLTQEQENKYHLIPSHSTISLIRFETEETMIRASDAEFELEQMSKLKVVDLTKHELATGSIIALKQNGIISYHYCSSSGLMEVPDYLKERLIQRAEPLSAKIDDKSESKNLHSSEDKKPSLLQKLKFLPQELSHPKQQKKCKEKEGINAR